MQSQILLGTRGRMTPFLFVLTYCVLHLRRVFTGGLFSCNTGSKGVGPIQIVHTDTHTHAARTHARTDTCTHTHTHARTHARTHAHAHAHTRTRTHTHTHSLTIAFCIHIYTQTQSKNRSRASDLCVKRQRLLINIRPRRR